MTETTARLRAALAHIHRVLEADRTARGAGSVRTTGGCSWRCCWACLSWAGCSMASQLRPRAWIGGKRR